MDRSSALRAPHFWLASCLALAIATPAGAAGLMLPPPGGVPQAIDFGRDPLLAFGRNAAAGPAVGPAALAALGEAVAHHPAVAAAIADAAVTSAVRMQVRAGLFPQIDLQFAGQRALARDFGDRSAITESLQPLSRADAGISGEQLLFDFGATGNRISASNDRIAAARAEVDRVAAEVAAQAVAAWYDVVAGQALAQLNAGMIDRQQAIIADVRARVAQGVGAGGDVARAQAMLAQSEAEGARFDRMLAQARGRYRALFGTDAPAGLGRAIPPPSVARSLDAAQAMGRRSPAVAAALRRAEAARRDVRAARADGLPRLTAGISGTRYDVFAGSDYEVRATLGLRQSLSAGGRQRGAVAEAQARAKGAGFSADLAAADSERDAGNAFTDVAALARATAALEAAYVANRRVRDAYVEQFRVSRGTLIELLRAERDYFDAAAGYVQGAIDVDIARYALLARTGEILPAIGIQFSTITSGGQP